MIKTLGLVGKFTDTLIALRNCATSSAATLARELEIPHSTASYRIQRLQEEGIVSGYTPIVNPLIFGDPYLVHIRVDPKQYQLHKDLERTITGLRQFFQSCIGHATLTFYVYQDQESEMWQVHCIIMTRNIERLTERLYREQNISKENIITISLETVDGIPNYDRFSFAEKTSQESGMKR